MVLAMQTHPPVAKTPSLTWGYHKRSLSMKVCWGEATVLEECHIYIFKAANARNMFFISKSWGRVQWGSIVFDRNNFYTFSTSGTIVLSSFSLTSELQPIQYPNGKCFSSKCGTQKPCAVLDFEMDIVELRCYLRGLCDCGWVSTPNVKFLSFRTKPSFIK